MCVFLDACSKNDSKEENDPTNAPEVSVTTIVTPVPQNTTPLVVGIDPFSEKFSPFFCDTVMDRQIVVMSSIVLLTTDRSGGLILNAIKGETVPYNGTDYTYKGISDITVNYDETTDLTTYKIKIRDDIKFSDGHVADADDIIFNYYVYSDTSYDGSSTLSSIPIIGMQNYRKNNSNAETTVISEEELTATMENLSEVAKEEIKTSIIVPTLTSELDWVKTLYGNDSYKNYTEEFPIAKDLFANFYSIDASYDASTVTDEAQVLADIIAQYGSNYKALGTGYAGDETYYVADVTAIVNEALLAEKLSAGGEEVPNITGIKKLSQTEVEIIVKGFNAAAIYQLFGIELAPLHYYGNETLYNYDNNQFGFTRGDVAAIKAKTTHPLGAGPYKFVKYENKVAYLEANANYYLGEPATKYLQYKESTEADLISGVGTGTIDVADPSGSTAAFDEIKSYNSNNELSGDKIFTSTVDNLGYGYIGLNAATMNVGGEPASEASRNLRKAFTTILSVYRDVAIDSYYGEVATVINYPISNTSWAAPQKSDEGYEVAYSKDVNDNSIYLAEMPAEDKYVVALNTAVEYLKAAGYGYDEATGKFTAAPEGAKLEYEILIGGDGAGNHPSFAILTKAKEELKKIGITLTINDPTESSVMWDILDAGTQELWCAAWQATIDPDMYQIYHSSSILGRGGSESNHYCIEDATLDQLIVDARKSSDQAYRKATYKACLDIILDWAVEVPIYQRQNCIIISNERVEVSTITPDITTYWNWNAEVEKLKMK
jgi:peptide/nickel transport system substrate-binding protein